ncbi:MAG TPA: hypothetical protein VFI47_05040 [Acidimicrobiales bacterium]|nr:hypothetical protein [Acidimicrobiales bacterium]
MHEVHSVVGEKEREFETAYRDGWMALLASGDDARLLWYLNQAHGSGPAYTVVTVTAVRDGDAYQRLAERLRGSDLLDWSRAVGEMRHDVVGKMLVPVHWSPLQAVDLATVPTDGAEHELSLYMEDTGWPSAPLDDYIDFWSDEYFQMMRKLPADRKILEIEGCFQPAFGTHRRPEAVLVQKILSYDLLMGLISEPEDYDPDTWPGSYMHRGLRYRDQWESRLLRTSAWSPLY